MKKIPNPKKMKRVDGPRLTRKEFDSAKIRITTYLDQDVLKELREIADDLGSKYQSVLNQLLRNSLFGKKEGLIARIDRLEKVLKVQKG